jgi:hypothetical protein
MDKRRDCLFVPGVSHGGLVNPDVPVADLLGDTPIGVLPSFKGLLPHSLGSELPRVGGVLGRTFSGISSPSFGGRGSLEGTVWTESWSLSFAPLFPKISL